MKATGRQRTRRMARRALLQVLYEVDSSGHSVEDSLRWVVEQLSLDEESVAFVEAIAAGVLQHRRELDDETHRYAPTWPVSQLPAVDRNILRIAIYEILMSRETPPKVAINEAVELAKQFGGENLPPFVNGVLGAVMQTIASEKT